MASIKILQKVERTRQETAAVPPPAVVFRTQQDPCYECCQRLLQMMVFTTHTRLHGYERLLLVFLCLLIPTFELLFMIVITGASFSHLASRLHGQRNGSKEIAPIEGTSHSFAHSNTWPGHSIIIRTPEPLAVTTMAVFNVTQMLNPSRASRNPAIAPAPSNPLVAPSLRFFFVFAFLSSSAALAFCL
jgi:hypothetical protein